RGGEARGVGDRRAADAVHAARPRIVGANAHDAATALGSHAHAAVDTATALAVRPADALAAAAHRADAVAGDARGTGRADAARTAPRQLFRAPGPRTRPHRLARRATRCGGDRRCRLRGARGD